MTLLGSVRSAWKSRRVTPTRPKGYARIVIEVPVASITEGYLTKKSFIAFVVRALTKGYDAIFDKTYRI